MGRIVVFGQSHLATRLGEITARLGLDAEAAPLEPPSPAMLQAWHGRLRPEKSPESADLLEEIANARAALVCDRRDEVNLSLALRLRDACPDLRLVVSFYDPRLGRKIQQELGACAVVSPADLSAAAFAAAALERGLVQAVDFEGATCAFLHAPAGEGQLLPGLRFRRLADLADADDDSGPQAPAALRRLPRHADGYFLGILALIATTLAGATAYFHYSQHLPWMSALYFVVTTFCTVGYGDFSLRDASDAAKAAGIALMLASVTLTAGLFAILTNALVARRTDAREGRRRHRLRGHVLVCGLGSLGLRVAEHLAAVGVKALVIDKDRDNPLLEDLEARRIPFMVADATRVGALKAARVEQARALVCTLNDDLVALEIGLAARAARPGLRVVLRVFDGAFADRVERHFHIRTALSTSSLAAPSFLARALDPEAQALLEWEGGWHLVAERDPGAVPRPGERILAQGARTLVLAPFNP